MQEVSIYLDIKSFANGILLTGMSTCNIQLNLTIYSSIIGTIIILCGPDNVYYVLAF